MDEDQPTRRGGGAHQGAVLAATDIPAWEELRKRYDEKWLTEREEFHRKLKENFSVITEQFRSGKQEVYQLNVNILSDRYIKAFRELFSDTGYQASVGDLETAPGGKKLKKLYIVLPNCSQ